MAPTSLIKAKGVKRIFDESEEFVKYRYRPRYVVSRDLVRRSLRMHHFGVRDTAQVETAWNKVRYMKPELYNNNKLLTLAVRCKIFRVFQESLCLCCMKVS